jgi:hypothetical protein
MVTPPVSLIHAARVSIDRWFDVPQAAAGPEVTPTNPILSTGLSAKAIVAKVSDATAETAVVLRKERLFMWQTP